MKKGWMYLFALFALCMWGCGQSYEKASINVNDTTKEKIEEAAPSSDYYFFAMKDSCPKNLDALSEAKLFICGETEPKADIKIIMSSVAEKSRPLVKELQSYWINPNVIKGEMRASEDITITLNSGGKYVIPSVRKIYGKDRSPEDLLKMCIEEMNNNPNSVLLIKKSEVTALLNDMALLNFDVLK